MKRIFSIILVMSMLFSSVAFGVTTEDNDNKTITLTNEDREYFRQISIDPDDVILLAKWTEDSEGKNQINKKDLDARYSSDVQVYYEYRLKSEEMNKVLSNGFSEGISTRGVDPGGSDYTTRYRTAWIKNFTTDVGNSLKDETAVWLDRPVSIATGLMSPIIWIPMTAFGISPSRFMPDYYPGDQLTVFYSDTMTDKIYSAYCHKTGRIEDVVSVRHSAVTVSSLLSYYDVVDQAIHHYHSNEQIKHKYSIHYNDYAWISSQISFQSQQFFPRLVIDTF